MDASALVSASRIREDVAHLATAIGARESGTDGERLGLRFVAETWSDLGLQPQWETAVPLKPLSSDTSNVGVVLPGRSPGPRIELGAHIDSIRRRPRCPGANDNASGVAALLEISRVLVLHPPAGSVALWVFGGEETVDGVLEHHHFGSRHHARRLRAEGNLGISAMISVDMVGVGQRTVVERLGSGWAETALAERLVATARTQGLQAQEGPVGRPFSDHEPYHYLGVPAVWLRCGPDPGNHSSKDVSAGVDAALVAAHARLVLDCLRALQGTATDHGAK